MRTEFRVALYLHHYGYSPERVSSLMDVPLPEVQAIKGGKLSVEAASVLPEQRKPRCTRAEKVKAVRLVAAGMAPEEAALKANVTLETVKAAMRNLKKDRYLKHLNLTS